MDRYRANLKRASWDWLEERKDGRKDRVNGRGEKRSARQSDRKEVEADSRLPTNKPCEECSEPECPGGRK